MALADITGDCWEIFWLIITRSNILKGIVISSFFTLFIYLCQLLFKKETQKFFVPCIAIILFFLMPNSLFAQIIGWSAAFVNFFPPIVIWMTILCLLSSLTDDEHYTTGKNRYIYLFLLGAAMELFSENNSIYGLMFAAAVIAYGYYKEKKLHKDFIALFIGTLIGFLIMFLNSAYINAASGTDGYKEIGITGGEGFISFILDKYKNMVEPLFTNNTLVVGLICLLLIWLIVKQLKLGSKYKMQSFVCLAFISLVFIFILCATPTVRNRINIFGGVYHKLNFIFSIGFFICTLYCAFAMTSGSVRKRLVIIFYVTVMAETGSSYRKWLADMEYVKETGAKELTLKKLPNSRYFWTTEPSNEKWEGFSGSFTELTMTLNLNGLSKSLQKRKNIVYYI